MKNPLFVLVRPFYRQQAFRKVQEYTELAAYWETVHCPNTAAAMREQVDRYQAQYERYMPRHGA